ncbi:MAG: hypothetical protein ABL949_11175 [Fimbriimonadaceae bacterium]
MVSVALFLLTAQFGFSPTLMMSAPSMAVQRPEVRKELKPTKDQNRKLDEIVKSVNQAMKDSQKTLDMGAISQTMKDGDAKVWELLDDKQDERLRGLVLQIKGPAAFFEEDFIKEFALTSDQIAKLEELKASCGSLYMEAARGNPRKLKGLLEKYEKDTLAVLTADQKLKYDKAVGAKVKNLNLGLPPF